MLPPCLFYRLDHSSRFLPQLSGHWPEADSPVAAGSPVRKWHFTASEDFGNKQHASETVPQRIPKAHKWTTEITKNDACSRPSNLLGDRSFAWQRNTSLTLQKSCHSNDIATYCNSLVLATKKLYWAVGSARTALPITVLYCSIDIYRLDHPSGFIPQLSGHWPEATSAVSAVASCAGAFSPGKGLLGPPPSWKRMGHLKICFIASSWN